MENNTLGSSIAVMNAKGGVGKSTVTLAVAETLSYYYGKKVLVIDSDAQMSISVMLMPFEELNKKRADWKTLVGLLHQTLILGQTPDWKTFVTSNVSDVDDTETVDLLPGDLRLTLVERAVTEADRHEQMRGLVRSVLAEARLNYDYILIDCPPGLSLLTEIWLREADYHLAPAKPDFLAIAGLEMFREFKKINPDLKMAENLGILVNMKNRNSVEDDHYHAILANDEESRCFADPIPHMAPIQHAARFSVESRSFAAKYPGAAGEAFRNTVHEMLRRTGDAEKTDVAEISEAAPIMATTADIVAAPAAEAAVAPVRVAEAGPEIQAQEPPAIAPVAPVAVAVAAPARVEVPVQEVPLQTQPEPVVETQPQIETTIVAPLVPVQVATAPLAPPAPLQVAAAPLAPPSAAPAVAPVLAGVVAAAVAPQIVVEEMVPPQISAAALEAQAFAATAPVPVAAPEVDATSGLPEMPAQLSAILSPKEL